MPSRTAGPAGNAQSTPSGRSGGRTQNSSSQPPWPWAVSSPKLIRVRSGPRPPSARASSVSQAEISPARGGCRSATSTRPGKLAGRSQPGETGAHDHRVKALHRPGHHRPPGLAITNTRRGRRRMSQNVAPASLTRATARPRLH